MARSICLRIVVSIFLLYIGAFVFSTKVLALPDCASAGYSNPGTNSSCGVTDTNTYSIDACQFTDTVYKCGGITTCIATASSCSSRQSICNNGYGGTPNDGYTCQSYCNALATPANCGDYPTSDPRPDCFTYKFNCGRYDCTSAGGTYPGGAPNYTCPSNQVCTSNHICVTQSPAVSLNVNNVSVLTVNKGDEFILSWNITGSDSTCAGSNTWTNSDAPTAGPASSSVTKSLNDTGTYVYSLTCSNSAGSDTKSVAVNVNKTCPDYTSCSACVSQNSCGWKGDTNSCQTGTSSCPANTTSWFWTDCLTNMCVSGSSTPTTAPTTSTCTDPLTCSISASATSSTSGRATISKTGGCSTGYDRVEWFLGTSGGTLQSKGSNFGPSADFSSLTTDTTYSVSASWWSISDSTKPSVICQPPASFTPTSTSTPPSSTTTTPPSDYKCLKCGSDSGGRYYWGLSCPDLVNVRSFCSGVCSTQTEKSANNYPQRTGEYCWVATASPPAPQEINGEIWIREINQPETKATSSFYQSAPDGKIWFWFSHFARYEEDPVPVSGHCHNKGFLNTYVNCFQENRVDANRAYIGYSDANVGNKSNSADIHKDHLKLVQWPPGYKPVGEYYEYQEVQAINSRTQCASNATYTCSDACHRGTDATSIAYNCSSCGGVSCENTGCSCSPTETVNDGYECRTKPKEVKALGTLTQGILNQIASYCDPTNGNARIDLVFEKLPLLSGLVCKDNNGDGSCITVTDNSRTCTDEVYPSGTVTATKSSTGPTFSREVTPGGGYSMPIPAGNYNVGFSAPNVTLTSPTLPLLIPITADYTQDFCVNPLSAWLKTTGGDVHSNTGIFTPGGP